MSRATFDYDSAHTFVENNPAARWDGWDIVLFTPNDYGFSNPAGAFQGERTVVRNGKLVTLKGRWGMQVRVSPDEKGLWHVNHKSVR